jgi:hypothetical protein
MSFFGPTERHPVIAGAVCFLVLAAAVVGGVAGYRKLVYGKARQEAAVAVHTASNELRRLEAALAQTQALFKKSGAGLGAEERIKLNAAVVIVQDNLPLYQTVLSNAGSALQGKNFKFFRSSFDGVQQSNLLQALERDGQTLDQVTSYCRARTR